uniref:NADH-ubiquinone oxidoreductase chain 2 n=1 Tax=Glaucosoma buergeri TaxID=443781 RepID=A0A348B085_9TELE|nr:NADH dehydrogenase subunit 2 [Glaucosoma buergeri]
MHPALLMMLISGLGLGTTIVFSSSHWLLAWMGLEINTLAILPIMANNHHPRAIEATTKYFLIQATAASLLLFATITNSWLTGQWHVQLIPHPIPGALMILALATKLGLAPVHFWLPEILQGLDLTTGLILSTWQKLAPFALLLHLQPTNSNLLIVLGVASTFIGGWGGLNQTQLRKILAYSSIAHLGWIALILQFSPSLATMTLTIYIVMTSSTFLAFKLTESTSINQLTSSSYKFPALTSLIPLVLLSLAGLPPLTGFLPKWLIIQEMAKQSLAPTATLAILSALLSLYFYLRLSYAMTLTMPPNNLTGTTPWRLQTSQPTMPLAISTTATLLLLPLAPAVLALLTH